MEMRVNYNTEATFDYENKMNLGYTGDEDQIIKKIEAGNVSLPLNGSLITGGSNLFGVKTEMQFGKLNLTTIFSQHKGETQVVESEGGDPPAGWETKDGKLEWIPESEVLKKQVVADLQHTFPYVCGGQGIFYGVVTLDAAQNIVNVRLNLTQ